MAKSSYQIPTTPRLYVSYPLWQHANRGLSVMYNGDNPTLTKQGMYKLINLDPSSTVNIVDANDNGAIIMGYNLIDKPAYQAYESGGTVILNNMPEHLWNFNYCMILNHNLATRNATPSLKSIRGADSNEVFWLGNETISGSSIVNWPSDTAPHQDGFSIMELDPYEADYNLGMGLIFEQTDGAADDPFTDGDNIELGSILWGKYFEFPSSCNVNASLSYKYDNSSITNIFGEKISTGKWNKVDGWHNTIYEKSFTGELEDVYGYGSTGIEPFGLRRTIWDDENISPMAIEKNTYHDTSTSHRRKSGIRVWNISFDSVAANRLMSQNPMMLDHGFDPINYAQDFGYPTYNNYELDTWDRNEHDINRADDFYTNVVHKTNGGSLPMVMQINKDDNSPHSFAIVKMSDYKIVEKNDNLYNISLTLEEQV